MGVDANISVIIPAKNEAHQIRHILSSLQNQDTSETYEVIVQIEACDAHNIVQDGTIQDERLGDVDVVCVRADVTDELVQV